MVWALAREATSIAEVSMSSSPRRKNHSLCTNQVTGCGDMDKRKAGGQEAYIVAVWGGGVLQHT